MEEWITSFFSKKLSPKIRSSETVRSIPTPASNNSLEQSKRENANSFVLKLSAKSLQDKLLHNQMVDLLLMIYTSWCERCSRVSSSFDKISEFIHNQTKLVQLAKLENSHNDLPPGIVISGSNYPYFKFFPASKKSPIDFPFAPQEREISQTEVVNFLFSHSQWKELKKNSDNKIPNRKKSKRHDEL